MYNFYPDEIRYGGEFEKFLSDDLVNDTWLSRGNILGLADVPGYKGPTGLCYSLQTFYSLCMVDFFQLIGAYQDSHGAIRIDSNKFFKDCDFDLRWLFRPMTEEAQQVTYVDYYTFPFSIIPSKTEDPQGRYKQTFAQFYPHEPEQQFPAGEFSRRVPIFNFHTSPRHMELGHQAPWPSAIGNYNPLFNFIINRPDGILNTPSGTVFSPHSRDMVSSMEDAGKPVAFIQIDPYDPLCWCCAPATPRECVTQVDFKEAQKIIHRYRISMLFYLSEFLQYYYIKKYHKELNTAQITSALYHSTIAWTAGPETGFSKDDAETKPTMRETIIPGEDKETASARGLAVTTTEQKEIKVMVDQGVVILSNRAYGLPQLHRGTPLYLPGSHHTTASRENSSIGTGFNYPWRTGTPTFTSATDADTRSVVSAAPSFAQTSPAGSPLRPWQTTSSAQSSPSRIMPGAIALSDITLTGASAPHWPSSGEAKHESPFPLNTEALPAAGHLGLDLGSDSDSESDADSESTPLTMQQGLRRLQVNRIRSERAQFDPTRARTRNFLGSGRSAYTVVPPVSTAAAPLPASSRPPLAPKWPPQRFNMIND